MNKFCLQLVTLGLQLVLPVLPGCLKAKEISTSLELLTQKTFAVPTGTAADKLVLSKSQPEIRILLQRARCSHGGEDRQSRRGGPRETDS